MVLGVRRPVFCLLICHFSCVYKQVILRRECLPISQTSLSALCGLSPAVFSCNCFCYSQISRFQPSPDQRFSQPLFMCFLAPNGCTKHFLLFCFHAFIVLDRAASCCKICIYVSGSIFFGTCGVASMARAPLSSVL